MSKVTIQGNASGTGTFTIASPNSDTDRTLTLPDEAGTVLTTSSDVLTSASIITASQSTSAVPVFSTYRSGSNFSFSASSWTKVEMNSTLVDTESDWDAVNYRYTPSMGGWYYATFVATHNGTGGARRFTSIWKNGNNLGYFQTRETGGEVRYNHNQLVYLNGSTDYIEAYVWSDASSPFVNYDDNGNETFFQGYLVRAD